jgi:hypothetical protein
MTDDQPPAAPTAPSACATDEWFAARLRATQSRQRNADGWAPVAAPVAAPAAAQCNDDATRALRAEGD